MAIKGLKSTQLANDPTTSALKFNFKTYEQKNAPFRNNTTDIDFVTYNGSLYVCVGDTGEGVPYKAGNPADNGFLLLVQKGADGRQGIDGKEGPMGPMPNYTLSFDGKQLVVVEQPSGIRKAVSPDLTGPVWVPELHDKKIVWVKEESSANTRPADIDLEALRPTEERPILLRTNSDNTKRSDESSGPANMIQWKHEGDEEWTNLISISELMNLTLAGVSFWQDPDDDDSWHFGHKEVVKATYSSDKNATKIVAVELGDVLFDAGKVPFPDNSLDLQAIQLTINELQTELNTIKLQLDGFAKKSDIPTVPTKVSAFENDVPYMSKASADATYQPIGNYAKRVNGYSPDANGEITIPLKTINGESIIGSGNITISASGLFSFDIKIENNKLYKKSNNDSDWVLVGDVNQGGGSGQGCPECWTREQIQDLINTSLEGLNLPDEWVTFADLDRFITISDLADYATKNYVESRIQDAMTDQGDLDYYRIFTLYQRTNSRTVAPNAPVQGNFVWDTSKGEIVLQPTFTSNWENHPQNATDEAPYLWQASATYSYKSKAEVKGDDETEYWHVICLTGEPGEDGANGYNGTDGADGNGVEFIYKLVNSLEEYNSLETPVAPAGEGEDDIPEGWLDHPEGISEEHPIEVASMRSYDGGSKSWGPYCAPFIWSMWGEDGIDGDGVEYIFFVAAQDLVITDQSTGKFSLDPTRYLQSNSPNFIPTTQQQVNNLGASYQVSDWISNVDNNWTDNPADVDEQQPFEFVSIRKYTDENGWGPFSEPKLWAHFGGITITPTQVVYGSTNYRPYTCYAFHRDSNDLSNYSVVYDFSSFGANSYSELTDDQKNQFYEAPQNYAKTLDANNNVVSIVWEDTVPAGNEQLWLITAHIGDESQASDTGWTSPTKWGDHAGFQVEYSNDSRAENAYLYPSLWNNHHLTLNDFTGTDEEREAAWREAVLVAYGVWSDDIKDPIYMATAVILPNGNWSNWTVAKIKGEKGEKGDTGPQGENGSPGADGTDIEFVYFRTDSESHRPGMSETEGTYDKETKVSEDFYEDDFLPLATADGFTLSDPELTIGSEFFWHDHPAGVTEQLPCEWVGMRHSSYQNGEKLWGKFNIALWSKYGANGRDGDGVEYVFWGLSEDDVQNITSYWPTQQESNDKNNGENVNPERVAHQKNIIDSEYLPAILINGVEREAIDNNPGIANNQYVFASMRKFRDGKWGEFSQIKLWNEQNNAELENIVLDIQDDSQNVLVDENGRILDRYMSGVYETEGLYLYKNLILLNNGNVSIKGDNGDVVVARLIPEAAQSNTYEKVDTTVTVTSGGVTATISPYWAWKYEDSLHSSVTLKVEFNKVANQNPILTDAFNIVINVEDATGNYIGSDVLKLVPRNSEKDLTLLHVPSTQRTSEQGGKSYSDSSFNFYGYYGSLYTTLALVSQTSFWFKYDDQANWTTFQIPANNVNLLNLINNVDGKQQGEYNFYFDRNGNILSNSTGAFYRIWLYNNDYKDNDHGEWTNWTAQAYVICDAFTATASYPVNELYFGIGFGNEMLDEANVHIIYPGKNGEQGPQGEKGEKGEKGDKGDKGDQGEPGVTTTVHEYQYLDYPVMRVSNWSGSQLKYYAGGTRVDENNNAVTGNEGTLFLDVIEYNYTNSENESATAYYKCISDITYASKVNEDPSSDTTHWEMFSIADNGAFRDLIVTNTAYIKSLGSDQVIILNGDNEIVAGLTGSTETVGSSHVRLWAGQPTTSNDLATTPFNVTDAGELTAKNASITGEINATSGSIGGFNINNVSLTANVTSNDVTSSTVPDIRFTTTMPDYDNETQQLNVGSYVVSGGGDFDEDVLATRIKMTRDRTSSGTNFHQELELTPTTGLSIKSTETESSEVNTNETNVVTITATGISYYDGTNTRSITWNKLIDKLNSI